MTQDESREIKDFKNVNINYRKFYFVLVLTTIGFFIFSILLLSRNYGERNLGGWTILSLFSSLKTTLIFIIAILILQFILNKVFKFNKSLLNSILITIFITGIFGYFISPPFSFGEKDLADFILLYESGFLFIGFFFVLIYFFTKILKFFVPNFWKLNLQPIIITFLLIMIILPFIIGGMNYIFTKLLACNFVSGKLQKFNCYRIKAIKTGDVNLCREKKLDLVTKGDCIIYIAIYKKDPSFCQQPEIKNNYNNYNYCLSAVNNEKANKPDLNY
jgi:hypothetical protein